jgi:anti-sigma B factor antagonist
MEANMINSPTLTIQPVTTDESRTVLRVSGEIDLATAGLLRDSVRGHLTPNAQVVLDVAEVTFCDSTGLGAILGLVRLAREAKGSLTLRSPGPRLDQLLKVTGVEHVVDVERGV